MTTATATTTMTDIKKKGIFTKTPTRNRRVRIATTNPVAYFFSSSFIKSNVGFVTIALLLLLCSCTVPTGVHGVGVKTSRLPLYEDTPTHCDEMVQLHKWEGSCCSLNVTEGNGCVLNVRDGYCRIYGQVWTLNYTSTSRIPCPPSEYSPDMLGMKPIQSEASIEEEESSAPTGGVNMGITILLTSVVAIVGTIFLL